MFATKFISCVAAICAAVFVSVGSAQEISPNQEGSVSGVGTTQVKKTPERMRLQVDLVAKGKNLAEAIQRLKERRQAAMTQLKTLGAAEGVQVDTAKIYESSNQQQQMMNMMIRQRMAGGRAKAKTQSVNIPVTVTAKLTAEWPLKVSNSDQLLTAAHDLQEKIKAADIGGTKDSEKLSPEEQELMEETAGGEEMVMYGQQEQKPGTPNFAYIASVSETERAAALVEAFKKAKAQASNLAQAAGMQLGSLRSLSAHSSMAEDGESYTNPYYQMMRQQMAAIEGSDNEAIGAQPTELKMQVVVTASFALK